MFSFKYWLQDMRASIVVFLVALPLCLGIALASNAPLSAGLIAGIVGGIVIGAVSGSPVSVSGPAAGLTVIVASGISELGSFEAFTLALFFSGILQILFGFLRGGVVGNYFPTSVITGMLSAIGIILILKQFPHALGLDSDYMGDEAFSQRDGENTFTEILIALGALHRGALLVSLVSAAIILYWDYLSMKGKSFFKFIPGALVAVLSGIFINEIFKSYFPDLNIENSHLVQLPFQGGFQDFFESLRFPNWSHVTKPEVYTVAFTLAIVGSLESLLSLDAADKIYSSPKPTSKNRELFAQGIGNMISGFLGGLPITAVIVRTSANVVAGARTNLSAILHGILLFVSIITIPKLMNLIPLSALAVVLIVVGYKLTKPALYKKMYERGFNQFIPYVVTILAILATDLLRGILIGMVVGFVFVFRSNIHKSIVLVKDDNMYLIRFYKDVSFLQKSSLIKMFDSIQEGGYVIIDGSKDVYVDDDVVDLIEDFCNRAKERNITVEMKKSTIALTTFFKEAHNG